MLDQQKNHLNDERNTAEIVRKVVDASPKDLNLFIYLFLKSLYIWSFQYIHIYNIYKNYCFPDEPCRKGKKQATKFHISTANFRQKLLQVSGRN